MYMIFCMYLNEEAHLNHIDQILQIINDYDLKMSLSKFMFNVSEHQMDIPFNICQFALSHM